MFSRLRPSRFPVRRLIHTQSHSFHPAPRLLAVTVGVISGSALAYTYLNSTTISLDSPGPATSPSTTEPSDASQPEAGSEEEHSQGAYNPETGEINWDCPCLGGMAHGTCGEDFRAAFSCFIFSEEEPKGINCIDKFQAMQNCFREHPEEYADQIGDDEDESTEQTPVSSEGNNSTSDIPKATDQSGEQSSSSFTSDIPETVEPSSSFTSDIPETTEQPRERSSSSPTPTKTISKSSSTSL